MVVWPLMKLTAKTARLPAETFAALETYRRATGLRSVNEVIALAVEELLKRSPSERKAS